MKNHADARIFNRDFVQVHHKVVDRSRKFEIFGAYLRSKLLRYGGKICHAEQIYKRY